jgi:HEAT repeat protein
VAETIDLISKNPLVVRYHLLQIGLTSDSLTLGRIGKKAVPTLIALLSRTGTPIAQAAYSTLARIGEPAKPALIASLKNGNPNQRIAAALLITTIDPRAGHVIPEDLRKTLAGALKEHQTGE